MKMTMQPDGKCAVSFLLKHEGHECELDHLRSHQEDPELLASSCCWYTTRTNLDGVRSSINENTLERKHLLTKKT